MKNIALIGNPNVGKTTLFNLLTGSNQYVGNWPGVTVEKKEGYHNDIKITDLPGIYALDTYSNEEKVSKDFLENGKPDLILNIVDASNLERNLYLTTQILKYNIPIIIAMNMLDIADLKGLDINTQTLEEELGITVIPIMATKGQGIEELKEALLKKENILIPKLKDYENEKVAYEEINKVLLKTAKLVKESQSMTRKIDKVVLNPLLAYPIFILMIYGVFKLTFSWLGAPLSDLLDAYVLTGISDFVSNLLSQSSPWFHSLIVDGIIGGVGAILVFLPIIMVMFAAISILEDSGYMARGALIMDKLMRKIGLSGKAFIPMLMGFGCTVPAIMSARTLESEKDRKLTALLAPFMSCNARLPVFILFGTIFFRNNAEIVVMSLYLLGIIMAILIGLVFKNTIFKKDEEPFIIELPEYKIPSMSLVVNSTWDKGKGFIKKASTIIFSLSVLVWFLSNFNMNGLTDMSSSLLASIGSVMAPVFAPLGFGTWEAAVALVTGIMAKEVVLSTMGVIYGGDLAAILPTIFTQLTAISFLVFVLLYTPCVAVIATIKKEYGGKFAAASSFFYFAVAWITSFLIYQIGSFIL
ncbi:ferrous iron transport protein B [Proteiniclasticum sp.]|uniref:ferrous iron transport protein B n=1 Tax=Proteiniclasticum sp. TaxID=2053595 RepID=UPI00289CEDCC|nr:ferrous iron transport protein B [Proteiniclasticum sp.]